MTRWEYHREPIDYLMRNRTLTVLGDDGWEAVCRLGDYLLLKRRKRPNRLALIKERGNRLMRWIFLLLPAALLLAPPVLAGDLDLRRQENECVALRADTDTQRAVRKFCHEMAWCNAGQLPDAVCAWYLHPMPKTAVGAQPKPMTEIPSVLR